MPLFVATRHSRRIIGLLVGTLVAFLILFAAVPEQSDASHREYCEYGGHSGGFDHGSPPGDGRYFWSQFSDQVYSATPNKQHYHLLRLYRDYLHHPNGHNELVGGHHCEYWGGSWLPEWQIPPH
jgi:hypothetical protein